LNKIENETKAHTELLQYYPKSEDMGMYAVVGIDMVNVPAWGGDGSV
jgi:hypothetical protein